MNAVTSASARCVSVSTCACVCVSVIPALTGHRPQNTHCQMSDRQREISRAPFDDAANHPRWNRTTREDEVATEKCRLMPLVTSFHLAVDDCSSSRVVDPLRPPLRSESPGPRGPLRVTASIELAFAGASPKREAMLAQLTSDENTITELL